MEENKKKSASISKKLQEDIDLYFKENKEAKQIQKIVNLGNNQKTEEGFDASAPIQYLSRSINSSNKQKRTLDLSGGSKKIISKPDEGEHEQESFANQLQDPEIYEQYTSMTSTKAKPIAKKPTKEPSEDEEEEEIELVKKSKTTKAPVTVQKKKKQEEPQEEDEEEKEVILAPKQKPPIAKQPEKKKIQVISSEEEQDESPKQKSKKSVPKGVTRTWSDEEEEEEESPKEMLTKKKQVQKTPTKEKKEEDTSNEEATGSDDDKPKKNGKQKKTDDGKKKESGYSVFNIVTKNPEEISNRIANFEEIMQEHGLGEKATEAILVVMQTIMRKNRFKDAPSNHMKYILNQGVKEDRKWMASLNITNKTLLNMKVSVLSKLLHDTILEAAYRIMEENGGKLKLAKPPKITKAKETSSGQSKKPSKKTETQDSDQEQKMDVEEKEVKKTKTNGSSKGKRTLEEEEEAVPTSRKVKKQPPPETIAEEDKVKLDIELMQMIRLYSINILMRFINPDYQAAQKEYASRSDVPENRKTLLMKEQTYLLKIDSDKISMIAQITDFINLCAADDQEWSNFKKLIIDAGKHVVDFDVKEAEAKDKECCITKKKTTTTKDKLYIMYITAQLKDQKEPVVITRYVSEQWKARYYALYQIILQEDLVKNHLLGIYSQAYEDQDIKKQPMTNVVAFFMSADDAMAKLVKGLKRVYSVWFKLFSPEQMESIRPNVKGYLASHAEQLRKMHPAWFF